MAACDNLYGNRKEWHELRDFLEKKDPELIFYMRSMPTDDDSESRICYIPEIQKMLIEECPLEWVKERLSDNFHIQRIICGKAHHEEKY